MKKILALILVTVMAALVFAGCAAAGEKEVDLENLSVGYIMGGPEEWQQKQYDGAKFACDKLGIDIVMLNSEYEAEKEITNAEDLLSRGVDAIVMYTVNEQSGQEVAQMCNAQNVPLFIVDGGFKEGEGKATTVLTYSFYNTGAAIGEFVCENYPDSKMIFITGTPGNGVVEDYEKGLRDALTEGGNVELVSVQPGNWDRATTIQVMENIITSGIEFNVAFINNEDMAEGAASVLEEHGMQDDIAIVTTGGSERGVELLQENKIVMTTTASPAMEGITIVNYMWQYFNGIEVPERPFTDFTVITIDNIDETLPWTPNDEMYENIVNG